MKKFTRKTSNMRSQIKYLGSKMLNAELDKNDSKKFELGGAVKKIDSYKTRENYELILNRFIDFAKEKDDVFMRADIQEVFDKYGNEYLQTIADKSDSANTFHTVRSAMNKYSNTIHTIDNVPKRKLSNITQNRTAFNEMNNSKFFSDDKNKMLIDFAKATGGRRLDLRKITKESFRYENDMLVVDFLKSKGGRDRVAVILPEYKEKIESYLNEINHNEKLFATIHEHAPIHRLRANYANDLYEKIISDADFKKDVSTLYKERQFYEYEKNIKSEFYHSKASNFKGLRDDIYLVSQNLGHNRLNVSVNHYLYNR